MKIYNTKTRNVEEFRTLEKNKVKMYTCGPTVYNYIHIGNARMNVFFDTVRRIFEYLGYDVEFVQNVTDVDDRIIEAAAENGISEVEISNRYYDEYNQDLASLGVKRPDVQPRVTEHIPEIITLIEGLIEKGHAYELNGDVYFHVPSFEKYGALTNQSVDSLQSTERDVYVAEDKKCNHDFALWKAQKGNEITWDSPWGKGRPGWHIECSAMSMKYLGESFDIHGGGLDLCFPHHENEIAQSEAYTGQTFANFWMHNNYVTVEGQKMSKSVGNFTTVRNALEDYNGNELRFFFLSVNYRNPIDYKVEAMHQAKRNMERTEEALKRLFAVETEGVVKNELNNAVHQKKEAFLSYLKNDFDTAGVITLLMETVKEIHTLLDRNEVTKQEAKMLYELLQEMLQVLGVNLHEAQNQKLSKEEKQLIEKRNELKEQAKQEKDKEQKKILFQESDKIRDELLEKGIVLIDTKDGVRWEKH